MEWNEMEWNGMNERMNEWMNEWMKMPVSRQTQSFRMIKKCNPACWGFSLCQDVEKFIVPNASRIQRLTTLRPENPWKNNLDHTLKDFVHQQYLHIYACLILHDPLPIFDCD